MFSSINSYDEMYLRFSRYGEFNTGPRPDYYCKFFLPIFTQDVDLTIETTGDVFFSIRNSDPPMLNVDTRTITSFTVYPIIDLDLIDEKDNYLLLPMGTTKMISMKKVVIEKPTWVYFVILYGRKHIENIKLNINYNMKIKEFVVQ